jgi:phosphatidylinositol alpha-1,6-mannosyltransferase
MHIVFLASDPERQGGIQQFNRNLMRAARAAGASLDVVIRERSGSAVGFVFASMRSVLRHRPDALWCGHIKFAPVGWLLSFFGVRYAVFAHGVEVWRMNFFERMVLSRAAKVIAVSRYTKRAVADQCPSLEARILLLPNMVDGSAFSPGPKDPEYLRKHGLADAKILLTVARLDKREKMKGHDRVLRALPRVIAAIPNVKYLIVGSGDDLPRILKLAKELGVADRVVVRPAGKKELLECYRAADVFVMPSRSEGFGIAYLEALACGVPVIAGNKDGSVDPLLDGELGVLVDPDDIAGIAQAVIAVLEGAVAPGLLDGELLRKRVLEAYGPEVFGRNVERILESAAG